MTYHDTAAEAEAAYDHLDDLGQFSAAEIREMTDYETDGSNEDFTADAIQARLGRVAIPEQVRQEWIDSMHLTHPSSEGPFRHATPEERHFAARNMDKVRVTLEASRSGEK